MQFNYIYTVKDKLELKKPFNLYSIGAIALGNTTSYAFRVSLRFIQALSSNKSRKGAIFSAKLERTSYVLLTIFIFMQSNQKNKIEDFP